MKPISNEIQSQDIENEWHEILRTVDELQALYEKREELRRANATVLNGNEPSAPKQISSAADWREYRLSCLDYQQRKFAANSALAELNREIERVERQLLVTLPADTWFRHGALGFGTATSTGGVRFIELLAWRDPMPSLNHKTRRREQGGK